VRAATLADVLLMTAGAILYVLFGAFLFRRGLERYTSGSRFGAFG
jgi:hypothetical protein